MERADELRNALYDEIGVAAWGSIPTFCGAQCQTLDCTTFRAKATALYCVVCRLPERLSNQYIGPKSLLALLPRCTGTLGHCKLRYNFLARLPNRETLAAGVFLAAQQRRHLRHSLEISTSPHLTTTLPHPTVSGPRAYRLLVIAPT